MDRLISEQAAIDAICKVCVVIAKPSECQYRKGLFGGCEEYEAIKAIPSVQPKIGHWIIIDDCEQFIAKCSNCGRVEDTRMISRYPYCHCGAKMESEDKE